MRENVNPFNKFSDSDGFMLTDIETDETLMLIPCDTAGNFSWTGAVRAPLQRNAMQTTTTNNQYSDMEKPWISVPQEDWTGGRANEIFTKDTTRYEDGKRCQAGFNSVIYNAPLDYYSTGFRKAITNCPGSMHWEAVRSKVFVTTITNVPAGGLNGGELYIHIRRSGMPLAGLHVDLLDGLSENATVLASHTYGTDQITDTLCEFRKFEFSGQLEENHHYYLMVWCNGGDQEDHWEIGMKKTTSRLSFTSTKKYSDYEVFNHEIYYRIAEKQSVPGKRAIFFTYQQLQFMVYQNPTNSPSLWMNGDIGKVTAFTRTSLTDSTKNWTSNCYAGCMVGLVYGVGVQGQISVWRKISSNTKNTLTLEDGEWNNDPAAGSVYVIVDTPIWKQVTGHNFTNVIKDVHVIRDAVYFCQGDYNDIRKMRWHDGAFEWQTLTGVKASFIQSVRDSSGMMLWIGHNDDSNHNRSVERARLLDWESEARTVCEYEYVDETAEDEEELIRTVIAELKAAGTEVNVQTIVAKLIEKGEDINASNMKEWLERIAKVLKEGISGGNTEPDNDPDKVLIRQGIAALRSQGQEVTAQSIVTWLQSNGATITTDNMQTWLTKIAAVLAEGSSGGNDSGNEEPDTDPDKVLIRQAIKLIKAGGKEPTPIAIINYLQDNGATITAENIQTWLTKIAAVLAEKDSGEGGEEEEEVVGLKPEDGIVYSESYDYGRGDYDAVRYKVHVETFSSKDNKGYAVITLQESEDNEVFQDVESVKVNCAGDWYITAHCQWRYRRFKFESTGTWIDPEDAENKEPTKLNLVTITTELVPHFEDRITLFDNYGKITRLYEYGAEQYKSLWIFQEGMVSSVNKVDGALVNTYTLDRINLDELQTTADEWNGKAVNSADVYLVFGWLNGLQRYYNTQLEGKGPDHDDGLPFERQGRVTQIVSYPSNTFISIDGGNDGYSCVMMFNQSGWHEIYRAPNAGERIFDMAFQPIYGKRPDRLWIQVGDDVIWLAMPSKILYAIQDSEAEYTHESVLVSSWFTAGMTDIVKLWQSLKIMADYIDGETCWVEADYQIDEENVWHPIENRYTVSPSQKENFSDRVSVNGKKMRYRLRLQTTDYHKTPKVNVVVIEAVGRVDIKYSYSFYFRNIKYKRDLTGEFEDIEPIQVQNLLDNWANELKKLRLNSRWLIYDNKTVYLDATQTSILNELSEGYVAQITLNEL